MVGSVALSRFVTLSLVRSKVDGSSVMGGCWRGFWFPAWGVVVVAVVGLWLWI